jgi:hypothetical protein
MHYVDHYRKNVGFFSISILLNCIFKPKGMTKNLRYMEIITGLQRARRRIENESL